MDKSTYRALLRVLTLARMQANEKQPFSGEDDYAILKVVAWASEMEKEVD